MPLNIFLLEDQPHYATGMLHDISSINPAHDITHVESCEEGYEALKEQRVANDPFDVYIIDRHVPLFTKDLVKFVREPHGIDFAKQALDMHHQDYGYYPALAIWTSLGRNEELPKNIQTILAEPYNVTYLPKIANVRKVSSFLYTAQRPETFQ